MEKLSNKITIKILLIFKYVPLLFFSITNVLAIESIEDYFFAPDSKPYNRTYGEWEAKFWGNFMSILNQTNLLLLLITNQLKYAIIKR